MAAEPFWGQVQIVVTLNRCTDRTGEIALAHGAKVVHDDSRNMARIRTSGAARAATGEVIVTIDADSRMTSNMLVEIDRLLRTRCYTHLLIAIGELGALGHHGKAGEWTQGGEASQGGPSMLAPWV